MNTNSKSNYDWPRRIIAFDSIEEAAECTARVYFAIAQSNPESSVILPTDRSATLIFTAMKKIANEYEGCPFGDAHILSDTETFGVWAKHLSSRTRHINEKLLEPLREMGRAPINDNINLLSGIFTDNDPLAAAKITVRDFPPSVHAISISPRGEILAYDVDTYKDADQIIYDSPRILQIGDIGKNYIDESQPSNSIISIGLGTSLSAKLLMILIFEPQKAEIMRTMFTSSMTVKIPATLLQNHQNAFILTTKRIAHLANMDNEVIYTNDPIVAAKNIISFNNVISDHTYFIENGIDWETIRERINAVFIEFIEKAESERNNCEDYLKNNIDDGKVYPRREAERIVWNTLIEKLSNMNFEVLRSIQRSTLDKLQTYLSNIRKKICLLSKTLETEIMSLRSAKSNELNNIKNKIIQKIDTFVLEV